MNAPRGGYISVETEEYSTLDSAISKVKSDLAICKAVHEAGDLLYAFPNYRLSLENVDEGYAWEIKSPCCYSRGVTFSLNNSYIYLFGSQQSKWDDIVYIFDKQVVKLLNYYGRDVPEGLGVEIAQYEEKLASVSQNIDDPFNSGFISGLVFVGILPGLGIGIVVFPYPCVFSLIMPGEQ